MIKDAELRSKAQLIDGFILQNVDNDKDNFLSEENGPMARPTWKNG